MFTFSFDPVPERAGLKITLILFLVFSFIIIEAQQSKPPSAADFRNQMIAASEQKGDDALLELMKGNRFMVKPFVDGLIREALNDDLKGNLKGYDEKKSILEKTARNFESLFSEKSLAIAVGYLSVWTKEQMQKKLVADSIYSVGTKFRLAKKNDNAIAELNKALSVYNEIGDERGQAEVLGGLGAVYSEIEYEKCNYYYTEALAKREKVDDKILIGNTLNSFGTVYNTFLKDYPKSIEWYGKAEKLRTEIGDISGLRTTYLYTGSAHRSFADQLTDAANYSEAIVQSDKALELFRKINNRSEIAKTLNQKGFIYSRLGNEKTAITNLNEALKINQELNDSSGIADVLNNYGIVLQQAGRIERALESYNKALAIYSGKGKLSETIPVLNNMGICYFELKDYPRAEEYYQKGLKLSRDLNDTRNQVDILLNLANVLIFLGRLEESMSSYNSALAVAKSSGMPDLTWRVLAGMAENYERRGEIEKALEINHSMLNLIDSIRGNLKSDEFKSSYLAKERYVFEDIVNMLQTLDARYPGKEYDVQAFSYAEQGKSRAFLDLLGESAGRDEVPVSPETISLKDVQQMLPDKNTVLLEYMCGDSSSCLWVITKTKHALFRIPANKRLREEAEAIRLALLDPKQGAGEFFIPSATSLYEELVRPAESFFTKSSKLIVVPDGVLNYIPFEVLLTSGPQKISNVTYPGLPFLINKYPVSYVQSASILKGLLSMRSGSDAVKPSERKLLVFGDPVYEKPGSVEINGQLLGRLQYSGQEAEKIAALFKKGNSEVFLRENATEASLKGEKNLGSFNYLHFATHGYIDENNPGRSSLVLTKGQDDINDGLLKSDEIFNMKLRTDLVVLSACQTGLGKLVRGEGIVGLTRSFMYAGTPSVLVSLWSVSDNSTASLMEEFYKNLVTAGLNKTDALRKAQLTLMGDVKFAHPFYWAPFVLIGDWR